MGLRRQAREFALKILFQVDVGQLAGEEVIRYFLATNPAADDVGEYARVLARGVLKERAKLDALISAQAHHWKLGRLAGVDRNILRIASYELIHCPEVPVSVAIDEAIEIAKKYSTEESGSFINGILDKLQTLRPLPPGGPIRE
jgi:transcription antitermination protein NusB